MKKLRIITLIIIILYVLKIRNHFLIVNFEFCNKKRIIFNDKTKIPCWLKCRKKKRNKPIAKVTGQIYNQKRKTQHQNYTIHWNDYKIIEIQEQCCNLIVLVCFSFLSRENQKRISMQKYKRRIYYFRNSSKLHWRIEIEFKWKNLEHNMDSQEIIEWIHFCFVEITYLDNNKILRRNEISRWKTHCIRSS